MNTPKTKAWVEQNGVVPLVADKTRRAPEIDSLLEELGNVAGAIPYYAIYPADGGPPIILQNLISQKQVLEALAKAGPSKSETTGQATVMK